MKLDRIKVLDTSVRSSGWSYPLSVLEKIQLKIQVSPPNERFGELGFPQRHTIELENVAFTYDNPQLEGDSLYVDITILDSPRGKELKELGNNVNFVVVGFGELDENKQMQDTYEFVSIAAIPPQKYKLKPVLFTTPTEEPKPEDEPTQNEVDEVEEELNTLMGFLKKIF